MTVYFDKRRRRWCYDFEADSERHFGYCLDAHNNPVTSRSAARQAEHAARARAKIAPKLIDANAITIGLVAAKLMPRWQRGRDWENTKRYVRELLAQFGPETPIADIGENDVSGYIDWALVQPARHWQGGAGRTLANPPTGEKSALKDLGRTRSASTVNHYLVPLRQMFDYAHAMRDPVTRARVIEEPPKVPVLKAPKRLPRPVPDNVTQRVLSLLPLRHAKAVFLTLYFGFRKGEAYGITIKHIDFARGGILFTAEEVKSGRDEFLPGGQDAMAFLALLAGEAIARGHKTLIAWQPSKDAEWVPIASPKTAWRTAMKTIEEEFGARWRWHDLRAAFITGVAGSSLSGKLVQHMARHANFATTEVYIKLADNLAAEAAERATMRPALKIVAGGKG